MVVNLPEISRETLQKTASNKATVTALADDIISLKKPSGEVVTYDLKPKNKPKAFSETSTKRDMSHLGHKLSCWGQYVITTDWQTKEYQFGQLNDKAKIDEFLGMKDKLGLEQRDKMQFISPSQDWLDLANKLSDTELNTLVDLTYNISESVFSSTRNGDEIDNIVSEINKLPSEELSSFIESMVHVNDEAEPADKPDRARNKFGMITGKGSVVNGIFDNAGGKALRDYTKMAFSSELSHSEFEMVNAHIVNMEYPATSGLINAVSMVQGEAKDQLFNLLSSNKTEGITDVFGYFGELANQPYYISQYNIEYENGDKELTSVIDPPLNESEQGSLFESILAVEAKVGLAVTDHLIKQTGAGMGQVQSQVWQELASGVDEPAITLTKQNINELLAQGKENLVEGHNKQVRNSFRSTIYSPGRGEAILRAI